MALRFASVSMIVGKIEFALTPVPFKSASSESIMATAATLSVESATTLKGSGLIDLKDLRELLSYLSKNSKEISARYGNVAVTAVGAVQRQLLVLENQGGTKFFGAKTVGPLLRFSR